MRGWAYAAASAVHLAVLGGFALSEAPSSRSAPLVPARAIEIELASSAEAQPVAVQAPGSTAVAASETRPAQAATRSVVESAPIASSVPAESGDVERSTNWVVHPAGDIDLSLPRSAFARTENVPPEHPAIPTAPARASKSGGLVESLDARDAAMGLGRGGPIEATVDAAAHDPAAPVLGSAVFSVSVLGNGKIKVDTLNASSDRANWEKLAPIIENGLAGKAVRVPTSAKGIRVTVRVEASEQFPGGARPLPPEKQGLTASGSIGRVTEKKDHIDLEPPHVHLGYHGRKCGVDVVATPGAISAGGGCEVGVAMRVVETRILSEERL
jgi:hypothetical protein